MMEENKEEDAIVVSKKLQFYLEKNQPIHIKLKNGRSHNGTVKYIGADFVLLNCKDTGETAVFFLEILHIEPYVEGGVK